MSSTTTTTTPTATRPAPVPTADAAPAPRRERRGLKRTQFQVPGKMPVPLKVLWRGASPAQQEAAHKTAAAVLRTWLGKLKREEAAKELGLSGVRFWQLSQQAVSGLVVGCLRQPRYRGRPPTYVSEEGVGALRKKIATLERDLDCSRRLIEVLKDLPGHREAAARSSAERADGRGGGRKKPAPAAERGAAGVDRGPDGQRA